MFSQCLIIATESKLDHTFYMKRYSIAAGNVSVPVIVMVCLSIVWYSVMDLLPPPQEMPYGVKNNRCDYMVFYTQS